MHIINRSDLIKPQSFITAAFAGDLEYPGPMLFSPRNHFIGHAVYQGIISVGFANDTPLLVREYQFPLLNGRGGIHFYKDPADVGPATCMVSLNSFSSNREDGIVSVSDAVVDAREVTLTLVRKPGLTLQIEESRTILMPVISFILKCENHQIFHLSYTAHVSFVLKSDADPTAPEKVCTMMGDDGLVSHYWNGGYDAIGSVVVAGDPIP